MNPGGGSPDVTLTGQAYLASPNNVFTNTNTFNTGAFVVNSAATFAGTLIVNSATSTFNNSVTLGSSNTDTLTVNAAAHFYDNVIVDGNLTVSGTVTTVNTTNLEVKDKLITLNNGSLAADADGSGIEIEESSDGNITGYAKIGNTRASWALKTPAKGGTVLLTPGTAAFSTELISTASANRVLTLPNVSGTVALTSDITAAAHDPVTLGTANGLTLSTQALSLTAASAGVTGALTGTDWSTFNAKATDNLVVHLAGSETITGAKAIRAALTVGVLEVATVATYTGQLLFTRTDSSVASTGGSAEILIGGTTTGFITKFKALDTNLSTYSVQLGIANAYSSTNGLSLFRDHTNNKVSLEVLSTETLGSSLILTDRTLGTRYELYVDNGVLTVDAL